MKKKLTSTLLFMVISFTVSAGLLTGAITLLEGDRLWKNGKYHEAAKKYSPICTGSEIAFYRLKDLVIDWEGYIQDHKSDYSENNLKIESMNIMKYKNMVKDLMDKWVVRPVESSVGKADYDKAMKLKEEVVYKYMIMPESLTPSEYTQKNEQMRNLFLMAAQAGHSNAQYEYAELNAGETQMEWLRKSAKQKNVDALIKLGYNLWLGENTEQNVQEAMTYFRKAAEIDEYGRGQFFTAYNYETGDFLLKNERLAAYWYKESALCGLEQGMFRLGICYKDGIGIKQDFQLAFKWFLQAAQKSHTEAQLYTGLSYLTGTGIEKDIDKAIEWLQKASKGGNKKAEEILNDLGKDMP